MDKPRLNIGQKGHRVRPSDPCPIREIPWTERRPVEHAHHAREIGLVHGNKGAPDSKILNSEYRSAYISGYRNGAWWRYRRRPRYEGIDLHDLIYLPRYPHPPTIWLA